MKYDRIVVIRQEKSQQKKEIALREIAKMLERKERITVTALVKYTGFSESFFYKNQEVRNAIKEALLQQGESYNPKKVILDTAMEAKIIDLKMTIRKLRTEIEKLEKENRELNEKNERLQQKVNECIDKSVR